jgi:hypothetical protein
LTESLLPDDPQRNRGVPFLKKKKPPLSAAGASPSIGLINNSNIEEASNERVEVNGRIYLDVVHLCSIGSIGSNSVYKWKGSVQLIFTTESTSEV